MSITLESTTTTNYYITLELTTQNYNSILLVQVCPLQGQNMCGYPIKEIFYNINEKQKAMATYKRYIKKYI